MGNSAESGRCSSARWSRVPAEPCLDSTTTASGYATQNGLKNSEIVSNTVAPDNMSITMTTSRTVPYYFLQLVGVSSGTVKPIAKAGIQQDTEGNAV